MRRAAGYQDDLAYGPPVPNLPGYTHAQNMLSQTQAMHGIRRGKTTTLKFLHNRAVVEDNVALQGPAQQGDLHKFNRLPERGQGLQSQQHRSDYQLDMGAQAPAAPAQYGPEQVTDQSTWGLQTVRWTGAKTPGWLKYGSKVLRFFAYSTDKVLYSPVEEVRVRHFELRYHLQDDSLEILEPQTANSGLPQGRYLHRQKVLLSNGTPLKYQSLGVGAELIIYSRRFVVMGCDAATRQCMEQELGVTQPPDQPLPSGKFDATRKAQEDAELARRQQRALQASKGGKGLEDADDPFECPPGPSAMFDFWEDDTVPEHLHNKLLRFFCMWDNTKTVFGQKLGFALHYYLKDDTIEVVELHRRNTGRDPFPLLLRRCKLPKTPNIPPVAGRPLSPRSKRMMNIQYYHWTDINIGGIVQVYGRDLLVYDADASTKIWLQDQLQLRPEQLAPVPVDFDCGPKRPPLQVPPNTLGIGTDEDTLQNVLHLIPKRPSRDYANYMDNWNKVLRFSARMVPGQGGEALVGPFDAERRFIISFYLLDNSLSIFEPKRPNSGMKGGMFLDRMKVKKHRQDAYFSPEDFQIGTTICIYARHYELMEADTFTLRHMETDPERYPFADVDRVLDKIQAAASTTPGLLQALRTQLNAHDTEGLGYLTHKELKAALASTGIDVSMHEAITVVRGLGADMEGVVVEQFLQALSGTSSPAPDRSVPEGYQAGARVPDNHPPNVAGPRGYQATGVAPGSYPVVGMASKQAATAATQGGYQADAAAPSSYQAGAAAPSSYQAGARMPSKQLANAGTHLQQKHAEEPQWLQHGPKQKQPPVGKQSQAAQLVNRPVRPHAAHAVLQYAAAQQQSGKLAEEAAAVMEAGVRHAVTYQQQAASAAQLMSAAQVAAPTYRPSLPHVSPQSRDQSADVDYQRPMHQQPAADQVGRAAADARRMLQPPLTAWQDEEEAELGMTRMPHGPAAGMFSAADARGSGQVGPTRAPATHAVAVLPAAMGAKAQLREAVQQSGAADSQGVDKSRQDVATRAAARFEQPDQGGRRVLAWQAGPTAQDMQTAHQAGITNAHSRLMPQHDAGPPWSQDAPMQDQIGWPQSVHKVQPAVQRHQEMQSSGLVSGPKTHSLSHQPGTQAFPSAPAMPYAASAQRLYGHEWHDADCGEHVHGHARQWHAPDAKFGNAAPALQQHGTFDYEQEDDLAAAGNPYHSHAAYYAYDQDSKQGKGVRGRTDQQAWGQSRSPGAVPQQPAENVGLHSTQQAYTLPTAVQHAASRTSDCGKPHLSVRAAQPNRAVLDQVSKQKQPVSLWQTTNSALGGIHNKSNTVHSRP